MQSLNNLANRFDANSLSLIRLQVGFYAIQQTYTAKMIQIWVKGVKVDGSKIGNYKAYTAYFSQSDFATPSNFQPNTKSGKSFKTHKGWAGLRESDGYQTTNVDLEHKRDLRDSIKTDFDGSNTWQIYCNNTQQQKKIDGLEKMYGNVFYGLSSADERQVVEDVEGLIVSLIENSF